MGTSDDPFEHTRMTLVEHLEELRSRLFKGLLAVAVAFAIGFYFEKPIVAAVTGPYDRACAMLSEHWLEEARAIVAKDPSKAEDLFLEGWPEVEELRQRTSRLIAIRPAEGFLYGLKVVFYFALILGGPVLLWQLWQFIAAGLYPKERRLVFAYFPVSVAMFAAGILFGYFLMVPYAVYFLNRDPFATMSVTTSAYLTFLTGLCMAFGVIFQLPLVMSFLSRTGVIEPRAYSKYRGHFVIAAFVLAAVLTPPDPVTQMMLGIPLVLLYELGILGAKLMGRRAQTPGLVPSEGAS